MGFIEKKAIEEFKNGPFLELKRKIDQTLGFQMNVEVQWDSLSEEGKGHLYSESLEKIYFQPLLLALQAIAADDFGKKALGASLKKIFITNTEKCFGAKGIRFDGGTLVIDHLPAANINDTHVREKAIRQTLESHI